MLGKDFGLIMKMEFLEFQFSSQFQFPASRDPARQGGSSNLVPATHMGDLG